MLKPGLVLSGAGFRATLFHLGVVRLPRDVGVESTTASCEFVFDIFSALAPIERQLVQERTDAGLLAAWATGTQRREETNPSQRTAWICFVAMAGARS